jgi:hypothetical protein
VANPALPGWLAALAAAAGTGIGAAASKLVDKWRNRKQNRAATQAHEATTADKLVGTAMRLLDQVQEELADLRVQLGQCRDERRAQEDVIVGLRSLIERLTQERDSLRDLLDQATKPR